MAQLAGAVDSLTKEEARLLEAWEQRVATGTFSGGICATRTMRVMGRSGDTPVVLPVLARDDVLETLAEEERFAVGYGERLLKAARARGRAVFADGMLVDHYRPTDRSDLIVLSPLAGG